MNRPQRGADSGYFSMKGRGRLEGGSGKVEVGRWKVGSGNRGGIVDRGLSTDSTSGKVSASKHRFIEFRILG